MSKEAFEEERRLFYVALTRAKQQVYLSYADQRYRWGKPEFCRPSPFIDEIDPAYLEISNQETNRFAQKLPFRLPFSRNLPGKESGNIQQQPDLHSNFNRKIAMLKENSGKEKDPGDDETIHLIPGMMVEHQRFGTGKVMQVEGNPPDEKATVFFHNAGQKQLLLRFARLRIIT
jgi:DNA helicase-2/ATP-dependent DNA helicase PcrA